MITKIDKNAIWICDLTYTQQTIAADVMPAAVAGIATYFKKKKKNVDIKIYKYPEKLVKDLNEFTKNKKNIDKFINGELGNNLLFVYKTKAITENLQELAEIARMSFVECLKANNVDFKSFKKFIDNAISYHFLSSQDIFMGNKIFKKKFAYNIEAFLNNPDSEISKFSINPEKEITFSNSPEQIAIISKYKKIYGSSPVSIGRILSKVHVKKLFRENNFIENKNIFKPIKSIEQSGLQS